MKDLRDLIMGFKKQVPVKKVTKKVSSSLHARKTKKR